MDHLTVELAHLAETWGVPEEVIAEIRAILGGSHTMAVTLDGRDGSAPDEPRAVARYDRGSRLGAGAFGDVWRVYDRRLERTVAMKVLRGTLGPGAVGQFLVEARRIAGLQHPGIVQVHDLGQLPDGRWFYTMREVEGDTLWEPIRAMRRGEIGLRRVVEHVRAVCETVAFAHAAGVIHRDLKPENVMVGRFGEVLVLDWGVAALHGEEAGIAGTPHWMAPEQAGGAAATPGFDVYALGALLYAVLCGSSPYAGATGNILEAVRAAAPADLPPSTPDALRDLCSQAMCREPHARLDSAEALAGGLTAWLAGDRRRLRARALFADAEALRVGIERTRAEAAAHRAQADAALAGVDPRDPVSQKLAGWHAEDAADAALRRAEVMEAEYVATLQGALSFDDTLAEAHAALADRYAAWHRHAEVRGDHRIAARYEALLRAHDQGAHAAWLAGTGAVDLVTDPPAAEVEIFRYELQDRRLTPVLCDTLAAPLSGVELPLGSYLFVLRSSGRRPVRYPVCLGRGDRWTCADPDGRAIPVYLPTPEELGPEDCYVPAGWCPVGGDHVAVAPWAGARVWIDGFVIQRHPVTVARYIAWLDALVEAGRADDAARHALCTQRDQGSVPMVRPGRDGRYAPVTDQEGHEVLLDQPAMGLDWASAAAFAAWEAERTGLPWRLPGELEWEKAARGVDERVYPWGRFPEPTWACLGHSHRGAWRPVSLDDHPGDESPYGVRGMAGNVADWCLDPFESGGIPHIVGDRAVIDGAPDAEARAIRGGFWSAHVRIGRVAGRLGEPASRRAAEVGFRLARSLTGG